MPPISLTGPWTRCAREGLAWDRRSWFPSKNRSSKRAFRTRREVIKAAEAAAEAASLVDQAQAALGDTIAEAGGSGPDDPGAAPPALASSLALSELRPGAPESAAIRILFTVEPSGTAVLLAAGTERDWLRAWYAEMILRCRTRYERDQQSPG